jgi:hypothetical protein
MAKRRARATSKSTTDEPKSSDDAILVEARKRFRIARDADEVNRKNALDDLKFAWNFEDAQWPAAIKELRIGRPCLTDNRLPAFIRQVVNAQRANRPTISVAPASGDASVQSAQVQEGLVRHIEQCSKADLAYDNAFESAVTCSIGYFRVSTRYVDDQSFDQEICIDPVDNALSVYDDPDYELPDGADRNYCFLTELVDRDEFEAEYGFDPSEIDDAGLGDDYELWCEADKVRVAEYWRVRRESDTVTEDGVALPEGAEPRQRQVERKIVEQFLMTGDRVMKRTTFAATKLPIIPVYGEVKNIEGRKFRKSLIRDVKTLAQINNYWISAETEIVALQPKAPWIAPVGSFVTDKTKWDSANTENYTTLEYDPVTLEQPDGTQTPLPPPQRTPPPSFPAAIRETRMGIIEAMKAGMGIFDASLGARSNEVSGVAIDARAEQSDTATYHFIDNMTRAIRYAGEVIVELLPQIYDNARVVRILEPDGQPEMVAINALFPPIDPATGQAMTNVQMGRGRYDVVVKAGPNIATQREKTAQMVESLIKAYPPLMQIGGDILVKNLDFPEADKLAQRMQPQGALPPQVQQQMQAMQQALAQGKQAFEQLQQQLAAEKLRVAKAEVEKAALTMQLKDRSAQIDNARTDTVSENTRFLVNTLMRALELQVNARTPQDVLAEAGQMKPGIESLISSP